MVPTLKVPKDELRNNGFINGYIKDENREVQYDNSVYLLFKSPNITKFRKFLDSEYERTDLIIEDYDYGEFTVVVYKLNPQFKKDFDLVRKGKYSKTSLAFQNLFPKVKKIIKNGLYKDELSLQFRVFNKTPDMVEFWEKEFNMNFSEDLEVWRGYFEEQEILTKQMIEQYVK